jgi:crotonobetainyl-CoA:carnitine CoA-transferase CaiB-like acyl-CoA transferase
MMLKGVRVLEMGQNVAGPHAGQILADLGADVTKIERPGGDEGRKLGPPFAGDDPAWFHQVNRNKKSMIFDLKLAADRKRLLALMGSSDVFLHNTRPGVLKDFGLDAETVRRDHPKLIYADIGAFGSTGPMSQRPGYELLMQAYGGLMSLTGSPDGPPTRMGPSMVDLGTGMWAAIGILSALINRGVTRQGAHIEASLFETAVGFSSIPIVNYLASGEAPIRSVDGFAGLSPYGGFECADGRLIVGAGNDRLFGKLANCLGRPEWKDDNRYSDNVQRVEHRAELQSELTEIFTTRRVCEWMAILEKAGIPHAPIQTIPELTNDPQLAALDMISHLDLPGHPAAVRLPLSFNGERPGISRGTPTAGQNNEQSND